MLIREHESKVVKIGRVKTYVDDTKSTFTYRKFAVVDDSILDMIYEAYKKHKKLGRKEMDFEKFCINYIEGTYDHVIRQGWIEPV